MKKAFKLTALVFILATVLSLFTINVGAATYPSEDYWATEALNAAVKNQILYGKENGNLDPEANLTRAEMAAIIVRAFGANIKTDISRFSDVSPNQWYYDDIAKAVHMGVFVGDENNTMRPDDSIIREEAFTVLARALVLSSSDYSSLNRFTDKEDISDWAKEYLSILAKKGYVNGNENSELTPQDNITRAEFAQLMHNIFKTYFVTAGTYSSTGADSTLIRHENINLSNLTVPGDLVIGDGANLSTITLTNVKIQGRLLVRGAAQVKLVNVTVGENVVVKNINSNVHFDNYRNEKVFNNINIITSATFKTAGGGGGGTPSVTKTYTVKFDKNDEEATGTMANQSFTYNVEKALNVNAFLKTGYTFGGWNTKADGTGDSYADGQSVKNLTNVNGGTVTLYAVWVPNQYKVIYNGNGNNSNDAIMDPTTHIYDEDKNLSLNRYTKEDHSFKEWNTKADGTGTSYIDGQSVINLTTVNGGEVTLYAIWSYTGSAVPVKVTFHYSPLAGDTEVGEPIGLTAGESIPDSALYAKKREISNFEKYYVVDGYVKDKNVSDVYAEPNDYQDIVEYDWYYYFDPDGDGNGEWKIFNQHVTVITDMDVYLKIKQLSIDVDAPVGPANGYQFGIYYTDTTRLIDSIKNLMYTQRGKTPSHLEVLNIARDNITQDDKAIQKLIDLNVIDEDYNILNQKLFVRFSDVLKILGKDLEEYILDTAKSMFEDNSNDALKDSVLEYFKTKLESGSEADVKEVKGMMKEAINKALSNSETKDEALAAVETMLETILKDDAAFSELAESFGYDISDISNTTTREFISELIVNELDKEYEEYLNDNTKSTELLDLALQNIPYNKQSDGTYVYSNVSELIDKTTKEFIIGLVNANLSYEFVTDTNGPVAYTDEKLFEMAREKAVAMVLDLIVTDTNFLNDVIAKEFAGTPFESYTAEKIISFNSTVDLIVDMVQHELESLTDEYGNTDYDEFAKRLGYEDKNELLTEKKDSIMNAILKELEKEKFFNEIIKHTEFKDYTYAELKQITPIELLKERVQEEIQKMQIEELAKKISELGLTSNTNLDKAGLIDFIQEEITKEIIEKVNDNTDDSLFKELYAELTGTVYDDTLSAKNITAKIVKKQIGIYLEGGLANDEIKEIKRIFGLPDETTDQYVQELASDVENYINTNDSLYESALKEISDMTPAEADALSGKEFVIDIIESNISDDEGFREAYEKYKDEVYVTDSSYEDALISDLKEYAVNEAHNQLEDESVLKEEVEKLTGFEFDNIKSYGSTYELIVDYVKKEFELKDFNGIVNDFHYTDIDDLLDDARPYIIEDVLDETRNDADFRREELEMYINAGVTEEAKKITFADLPDAEDSDGDNLPDKPLDFVALYSEKAIALLDNITLMAELTDLGYSVETLFNKYGKDIVVQMLNNAYTITATNEENELFDTVFKEVSSRYTNYQGLPDELKKDAIKFIIDELGLRLKNDKDLFEKVLDIAKDELGYESIDPDTLPDNPKDFIIDIVMDEFEKGGDKQVELIDYAVDYLEKHTDMLDGLIDFAMDYLNSNEDQRDDLIDEVINTVYRSTLDELIRQLKEENEFVVTGDSLFVATGLRSELDKYSYENLIKKLPENIREKIFAIYPEQKIIDIYGGAFDDIITKIDAAVANKGGSIPSGFTFNINPIDDIYAPLYDSFVNILTNDQRADKIKDKIKYGENKYLPELVELLSVKSLFNGTIDDETDKYSGYQLKDFDYYYNLMLNAIILSDDAVTRYKELFSEDEIDDILLGYEELALKYVNLLVEFLDGYANGTKDPDNKYFDKIEGIIKGKFPEQFNKLINWYKDSALNKEYGSNDYEKVRKVIRELYNRYDMNTDVIYDDKYIDKALAKLDKILVAEDTTYVDYKGVTHENADIYEITVKGITGKFVVVSEDIYELSIKGIVITIAREWRN